MPPSAREPKTLDIQSELVANVLRVPVAPGDAVAAGDTVMLLESMKMEIPVLTEHAGTIRAVTVDAGDVVQEGEVLVVVDLAPVT